MSNRPPVKGRALAVAAAVAALVLILDQATKALVVERLSAYSVIEIIPGLFNIVSVRNPGAAFGILGQSDWGAFILTAVSVIALFIIGFLIKKATTRAEAFSLSLIWGGAAGNLIDRALSGEVVDFLDFQAGAYHWPAFNIADSAITIGVVIYIFTSLKNGKKEKG